MSDYLKNGQRTSNSPGITAPREIKVFMNFSPTRESQTNNANSESKDVQIMSPPPFSVMSSDREQMGPVHQMPVISK